MRVAAMCEGTRRALPGFDSTFGQHVWPPALQHLTDVLQRTTNRWSLPPPPLLAARAPCSAGPAPTRGPSAFLRRFRGGSSSRSPSFGGRRYTAAGLSHSRNYAWLPTAAWSLLASPRTRRVSASVGRSASGAAHCTGAPMLLFLQDRFKILFSDLRARQANSAAQPRCSAR